MKGELDKTAYEEEVALVHSSLAALNKPQWQEYLAAWDYR